MRYTIIIRNINKEKQLKDVHSIFNLIQENVMTWQVLCGQFVLNSISKVNSLRYDSADIKKVFRKFFTLMWIFRVQRLTAHYAVQ